MNIFIPYKIIDFIIGFIIFLGVLLGISYFHLSSKSEFQNITQSRKIPYIAQSVIINIYAPLEEYEKYKFAVKAKLTKNILVVDKQSRSQVFVPITTTDLPVYIYQVKSNSNLDKQNKKITKITIIANGIEQEINSNDVLFTTF